MRRALVVWSFLACALPLSAQQWAAAIRAKPEPTFEELVSLPLVYKPPGIQKVRVLHDLAYQQTSDKRLLMDVYLPSDSARHPLVLLVHGGVSPTERPKEWGNYRSWGRTLAASGIIAVAFNQRLGFPKRDYELGASDVRAAMDFVRQRATRWHAVDRICVAAFSGGGTMLAPLIANTPADVKCLVGFYPILDTKDTTGPEAEVNDDQRRRYSAVTAIQERDSLPVALFVARAGRDQIPGVKESIDRFTAAALEKNANLVLVTHPTGFHGFDTRNDDARSREIIVMAIEFMKRHLATSYR
jgi:dienelactone hydrolase